jgi:acyl-CoA hydrolase
MADDGPETLAPITFRTRRWVRPEDLNANGTLFGGSLLRPEIRAGDRFRLRRRGHSRHS